MKLHDSLLTLIASTFMVAFIFLLRPWVCNAQQDGPRGYLLTPEGSLDIGEDTGTPLDLSYDVPAGFTGELDKVVIDLK